MGIRRRRRKLTSLMSRLEQRVRSVELRSTNLLTDSQIQALLPPDGAVEAPTSVVGPDAPGQFRKVQDAYLYTAKHAGTIEDRVEIYLEADLGVVKDEKIEVRGIYVTADASLEIDVDGVFDVKHTDTPPWDNRELPIKITPPRVKHDPSQDQLPGVTITNTYSFVPETQAPTTLSARKRLSTKKLIDTYAITGTTVTITTNSTHKFKAGDVLFFDLFSSSPTAFGLDGLFKIDSVTSNTLVYTLPAGVVTPVPATAPVSASYVFPVAREYLPEGSTWADSSNNKIYYWDGVRWVDFSTVADPIRDGDPPAPPTNLEVESEGIANPKTAIASAKVTLSWTAPTTTAAGEPLTDLIGYVAKWRTVPTEDWKVKFIPLPNATSYTFENDVIFNQGTLYYFELYARDSGSQDSTAATATHTTVVKTTPLSSTKPTAPIIESKLGVMNVRWDGYMATTPLTLPPFDVQYIKIHRSTVAGFTPNDTTLITTLSAVSGNYASFADVAYNTSYYFRFVLQDTSGVQSLPSDIATAQVTPLVDTDLIVGNVLNSWAFNGNLISAGALADGSINAASLLGPNVVTQNAISANAIGANQIAAGAIIAGKIGANAITANEIAANTISAGMIKSNAIEADKIAVGALNGQLITGATIRTSANTARVELNNTGMYAYNTSGAVTFRVLNSNGSVFIADGVQIGGYATTGELNTVSGVANSASNTAANANSTATTANSTASSIATNVYQPGTTRINGGNIFTGSIVADTIEANAISTYIFNGREIRLSAFSTNQNPKISLTKDRIAAFRANNTTSFRLTASGDFYGDDIFIDTATVSGTITGGTIRTAATGKRVEMLAASNSIRFRDTNGSLAGEIEGLTLGMRLDSALGSFIGVGGGVTMGSGSTVATSVTSAGLVLLVAPTTTLGANLRRPDPGNVIQVVSSDLRIKENVFPITDGISVVSQLNPVTFNSKTDNTDKIISGFLAQEVSNIFPTNNYTVVTEISDTIPDIENVDVKDFQNNPLLSLNHVELMPYITKAVQELIEKVSYLEEKISNLEGGTP